METIKEKLPINDESIHAINILIKEISKKHNTTFEKIINIIEQEEKQKNDETTRQIANKELDEKKEIDEIETANTTPTNQIKQQPHEETQGKTQNETRNQNLISNLIPTHIFSYDAGYLELICGYCIDLLDLPIHQIATATNRSQKTIWSSYHNLKEKHPDIFKNEKINKDKTNDQENKKLDQTRPDSDENINNTTNTIPLAIFSNRNYSTFENLLLHLEKTHSTKQIAAMLGKNYKTIWTVLAKARRKAK